MYACPRHSTLAVGAIGYLATPHPLMRFLEGRRRHEWRHRKSRHRVAQCIGVGIDGIARHVVSHVHLIWLPVVSFMAEH